MITPYHAKYFAHQLTRRRSADRLEKRSQSLVNATVDLNPHQLDAALFAFVRRWGAIRCLGRGPGARWRRLEKG